MLPESKKSDDYIKIETDSDPVKKTSAESIKVSKANHRRGVINSIIYMANLLFIGCFLNSLNVIQPDITLAFGYSSQSVIWTSTFDLIGAVIFSVFNSVIIEKIGLKYNAILFSFCLLLASGFKFFLPYSIGLVYVGFLVKGAGAAFALNSMMKFCKVWFSDGERPFYFGFLSLGTLVGIGIAPFVPFIFLSNEVVDVGTSFYRIISFAIQLIYSNLWISKFCGVGNKNDIQKQKLLEFIRVLLETVWYKYYVIKSHSYFANMISEDSSLILCTYIYQEF